MPPRSLLEGHQRSFQQPSVRGGVGSCPRDRRTARPSAGGAWGHGVWGWGGRVATLPTPGRARAPAGTILPEDPRFPVTRSLCRAGPKPIPTARGCRPPCPDRGTAALPSRWPLKGFCSSVSLLVSPLPVLEHESQAGLKDLPRLLGAQHTPPHPRPSAGPHLTCGARCRTETRDTVFKMSSVSFKMKAGH